MEGGTGTVEGQTCVCVQPDIWVGRERSVECVERCGKCVCVSVCVKGEMQCGSKCMCVERMVCVCVETRLCLCFCVVCRYSVCVGSDVCVCLRVCMDGETGLCMSGVTVCVCRESWGVFLKGDLGMFVWTERWGVCVCRERERQEVCGEREGCLCGHV